ncbi:MAG: hypothetical protein M3Q97_02680 [Bacteroidota bacterium]|nr:hypothetical protein [Bacteroidota bacterium]
MPFSLRNLFFTGRPGPLQITNSRPADHILVKHKRSKGYFIFGKIDNPSFEFAKQNDLFACYPYSLKTGKHKDRCFYFSKSDLISHEAADNKSDHDL